MRLTATLLAVFTLLSTGALVQAVSHDAQACAKLTDCGSCVNASRCGYSVDTQSCIAKKGHSGTIVISAPQCKKVSSILAARSLTLAIRAEIYDTRVGPHTVNGTPNKPKSGRHLTSTWFAEPKNATTLAHININPDPSSDL
ncbi:uncharacterized protein C8Q71DRAFT_485187 [Rhodofomes roseus]|uniref:Uncharacterized protein n=1 Tax=Rhodofomes roseus TaxID=34475 RepID=A0ABQ8KPM9_9APHY|nr:uncharacterized protein C8Q71DRAFT_485187 [Rhodofomes roseus]KAH9840281.1 hypothetical protein C8Q71DRAFT_485187 [Rhodofomes roseus]